ncbi:MAG: hypothetical protein U5L45_16835 [Saprospiraceae bacterium]|nr:hypothetical protein [Saprospiraceae bacterium]
MVRFSGKARKTNHFLLFFASEASKKEKVYSNLIFHNYLATSILLAQRQEKRLFIFRRSRKMNSIPLFCASEASVW